MPITIKVERTLDDDFLSDVLITAFDGSYGGSWYWATLDNRVTSGFKIDTSSDMWLAVRITSDEEHCETPGEPVLDNALEQGIDVDHDTLRVGIQKILDGDEGCRLNDDIRDSILTGVLESDAGAIDAIGADCIVQAGVFGKIIYG